jgi:hypothetical protein
MAIDRGLTCSRITQDQINYTPYGFIPEILTISIEDHVKKVFNEASEEFLKKNPPKNDNTRFIHIGRHVLESHIKGYLNSKLYEMLHQIFSKVYPQLNDDELLTLSLFPRATSTDAYQHFNLLLMDHRMELKELPAILEKGACAFMADKTFELLEQKAKEMNL